VQLGRKNLRLLLDTEPAGDLLAMPIARVVRDGAGHFLYDANFIPPVLRISASTRLMLRVQRLIEILDDKSAAIGGNARNTAGGSAEFSTRQIASFWLLHAVNSALTPLRHQLIAKRGHPEELFVEMSRLAGALCTFALDAHPRDLPLYDHDNLSDCFDALDRHIRAHLEIIVPTNCVSIALKPADDCYFEGDITDQRSLGRSRWLLAIRAGMGDADLMVKAPQLIKVCSPVFVRELVKRALPGLPLTHLPTPPPAVSARVETQYFGLGKDGPCWEHMSKTRKVGVYVPGEFRDPEIEILVVLEN
jgi:type VI secretion system protein ImpJ